MVKKFTEEEDKFVLAKPQDKTWTEYLKESQYDGSRTQGCLAARGYRLGARSTFGNSRKYTFNEDVWDTLTPESCYWAGWLCSDGGISKNPNTKDKYVLKLELQKRDKHVIEDFVKFCGYTGKVFDAKGKDRNASYVKIHCGSKWPKVLKEKFSIAPAKTFNLKPPKIKDPYLIKCFLMGYVDGDGHIAYKVKDDKWKTVSIVIKGASKEIMVWIFDELQNMSEHVNHQNRERKKLYERLYEKSGNITYNCQIAGFQAAYIIDEFRKLPLPYLKRKWNKPEVLQFIKESKDKHPTKFS
jgi:hypothetical protein